MPGPRHETTPAAPADGAITDSGIFYTDPEVFSQRFDALVADIRKPEAAAEALISFRALFSDSRVLPVLESHLHSAVVADDTSLDRFGTLKLRSTRLETAMASLNDAYCFGGPDISQLAAEGLRAMTKRVFELGAERMSPDEKSEFLKAHGVHVTDADMQVQELIDDYMSIDRVHDRRPVLSEFAAAAASKLAESGVITPDFVPNVVMPIDLQISEDTRELLKSMPQEVREALGENDEQVRTAVEEMLVRNYGIFNRAQEGKIPALTNGVDDKPVLLVYGAVLDRRYDLKTEKKLKDFVEAGISGAADEDSISSAEVIRRIKPALTPGSADPDLDSATNVLAMLLRRFTGITPTDKVAFKPDNPGMPSKFEAWLDSVAKAAGIKPQDNPGGGSVQMARGVPRENVVIYTNRLNETVAKALSGPDFSNISYMRITPEEIKIMPISEAGSDADPQEIGRPVETAKGLFIHICEEEEGEALDITTAEEKIIFGSALPKDTPIFRVETPGKTGDDKALADDETLLQIARRFKVIIVNGVHYSSKASQPPGKGEETVAHQLNILSEGAESPLVSVELSGVTGIPDLHDADQTASFRKSMDYVARILAGNLSSISMNYQELRSVLTAVKLCFEDSSDGEKQRRGASIVVQDGESPHALYHNAETLARALGVERLHVHGEDFDLTLRKDAEPLDLQVEWLGNMYQKYGVIARVMTDKGAVPAPEDPENAFLLPPNLKREGMLDVMKLAAALASSPALSEIARKDFISSLVRNGYYVNVAGYSVVVNVPKWAYAGTDGFRKFSRGREGLSLTGSGDTSAALSVILCRMKESRESKKEIAESNGF